jgi:DNA-directed RNA polymerase subunit beta
LEKLLQKENQILHLKKNFLRAIFGDKAGDVKDASLKASHSLFGVVIDKKLFSRAVKDRKLKLLIKPILEQNR